MKQAIYRPHTGGILKATSPSDFEGHLIRYGGQSDRDLEKEFFSAKTYLMRKAGYPVVGAPVNVQHGALKEFGSVGIGIFDFADEDEVGLFVRGLLHDREKYIEMLKEIGRVKGLKISDAQLGRKADLAVKAVTSLVADVPLQQSMGADVLTWIVSEGGHIDQAGIIHGALTPTPADNKNPIVQFAGTIKSVYALENERKTFDMATPASGSIATPSLGEATQEPIEASTALQTDEESADNEPQNENTNNENEEMTMTPEEVMALIQESIPAIAAAVAEEMGMSEDELSEEEKAAVVSETAEEAKADDDIVKAEDDEEDDEEDDGETKSIRVTSVLGILAKNAANALDKKRRTKSAAIKAAANGAANEWKNGQSGQSKAGGAVAAATQRNMSVSEDLRFANFSATDMALAVKLAKSQYPELVRDTMTLGQIIPDKTFQNHLKMKISQALETKPFTGKDASALKAILPFKSLKADELMATDIAAQGDEWTSIFYVMDSWRAAEEDNQLLNLLRSRRMQFVTVPRGVDQVEFKTTDQGATMYTRNEPNSIDSTLRPEVTVNYSTPVTGKIVKPLSEHVVAVVYSHRLDLQSLLNVAQEINWDVTQAMGEGTENAILNADTRTAANTNINLIDGTPAGGIQKPLYLAWNGLRLESLITVAAQSRDGGTLSTEDYLETLALFPHRIQARTKDLLFVIDPSTKNATRKLTDIKTKDVAGDENTLFTGQIPDLFDVTVYTSAQLALTDTAGKYTAAGGTKGQINAIYGPYCAYGRQQDIVVETARDIDSGATKFVANIYHVFMSRQADSATISYNLTV